MWLQLTSWLQIPNYKSLLVLNKPVFAGETSGSLYVSHPAQHTHLQKTRFCRNFSVDKPKNMMYNTKDLGGKPNTGL